MAISILIGIFIFGIIIFVHELGHFITARACGVAINEFAMGMGPKILWRRGKDDIVYSIRLLPIGGFVSMVGEDEESDDQRAINKKPIWQRSLVLVSGASMNLLSGFLVMSLLVVFMQQLYSNKIEGFYARDENGSYVDHYRGFEIGDEIIKVGKKRINVRSDLIFAVMRVGEKSADVTVIRNGQKTVIPAVRFPTTVEKGVVFGDAMFFMPETLEKNVGTVAKEAICQSISTVNMIWATFVDLLSGRYGAEAVSGPVGVVGEISETAQYGVAGLAYLFVLISMNVGLFNLLPFPALDGGRLVFLGLELIRKKPVKARYEGYIHLAGLALLLLLMAFVTFNDIVSLIKK